MNLFLKGYLILILLLTTISCEKDKTFVPLQNTWSFEKFHTNNHSDSYIKEKFHDNEIYIQFNKDKTFIAKGFGASFDGGYEANDNGELKIYFNDSAWLYAGALGDGLVDSWDYRYKYSLYTATNYSIEMYNLKIYNKNTEIIYFTKKMIISN